MERIFTTEEARALLPAVRRLVAAMVAGGTRIDELQDAHRVASYRAQRPGAGPAEQEAESAAAAALGREQDAFVDAVRQLDDLGVEIKDTRAGLVDFPSLRDGEVVELCWRLDEPTLAHWHRRGEGFAGRRPL